MGTHIVRSLTIDGELVAQTEALPEPAGWDTFQDTVEESGDGIIVQLIDSRSDLVVAEEIAGEGYPAY